jgi:transposase
VITHVASVPAPAPEERMPLVIEEQLRQQDLLPAEHLMDAGYITAETLVQAQEQFGVEIVGPTRAGATWEAGISKGGYPASAFAIDWEHHQATCPQGKISRTWSQELDCNGHPMMTIGFSRSDCRICPVRQECITSKAVARSIHIRTQKHYLALQAARQRQSTPAFVRRYDARAGIEGTISEGACEPLACVAHATSAYKKRTCSIWALRQLSIWFGLRPGSTARNESTPVNRPSFVLCLLPN